MMYNRRVNTWFIARTKAQREAYALQNLTVRHLNVFLPRLVEFDYPSDGAAGGTGRRPAPLFPGYLFIRMTFPDDYYRVIWTPGVRDLVSLGNGPIPIAEEVIAGIRARCDTAGILRMAQTGWSPGDRLEIPAGPFAGLLATVVTVMPRRRRIKLLIDFLSQQTPVEMPIAVLRPGRVVGPAPRPRVASLPAISA